jgi:hypothetical protein
MEEFDRRVHAIIQDELEEDKLLMLRFVDDFDSLATNKNTVIKVDKAMKTVGDQMKLQFTEEQADEEGNLQFLDLRQNTKEGLCVQYAQRSIKPILTYKSNHSKNVFEGIVMGAFKSAMSRSCACSVNQAIKDQEKRLAKAHYPGILIQKTKRKLLSKKPKRKWEEKRVGVAPQIHVLTHNMKRVGKDYNLQVTSNYVNKFSKLPARIDHMRAGNKQKCKEHAMEPFPCTKNTVYEIGLSCGSKYIGESGRCPNVRFDEHFEGKGTTTTIKNHIKRCKCKIELEESHLILDKPIVGTHARKVAEAVIMTRRAEEIGINKIISSISVTPTRRELEFIQRKGLLPFNQKTK